MRKITSVQALLCYLCIIFSPRMFAGDYSGNISADYLRTLFAFKADEKLKYSQCKEKTYYTCTYIWGLDSSKDAARINLGLAPEGNKLQITYAQAKNQIDFQRVTSSYSDAIIVNDLGEMAVWSEKRKQLSLITAENLIIHIHIQSQDIDPKEKSISIAKDLLVKI